MPINHSTVLRALARHIGRHNGAHIDQLVAEITGGDGTEPCQQRHVRLVILELRTEGHHICGHPATGYFIAESPEELDATCEFLYQRALASLRQISAMKHIALPDLRGQLKLPT